MKKGILMAHEINTKEPKTFLKRKKKGVTQNPMEEGKKKETTLD